MLVHLDASTHQWIAGGAEMQDLVVNGYPKVFNIEADPREELAGSYPWVIGPILKTIREYKASLQEHPNPPAPNMTRF